MTIFVEGGGVGEDTPELMFSYVSQSERTILFLLQINVLLLAKIINYT